MRNFLFIAIVIVLIGGIGWMLRSNPFGGGGSEQSALADLSVDSLFTTGSSSEFSAEPANVPPPISQL